MVPIVKFIRLTPLALAWVATAHATTLTTGAVPPGSDEIVCYVTNVGTKPLNVTADMLGLAGTTIAELQDCNMGAVAPKHSCSLTNFGSSANGVAYCTATASGSFRLTLNVIAGHILTSVAGTK